MLLNLQLYNIYTCEEFKWGGTYAIFWNGVDTNSVVDAKWC